MKESKTDMESKLRDVGVKVPETRIRSITDLKTINAPDLPTFDMVSDKTSAGIVITPTDLNVVTPTQPQSIVLKEVPAMSLMKSEGTGTRELSIAEQMFFTGKSKAELTGEVTPTPTKPEPLTIVPSAEVPPEVSVPRSIELRMQKEREQAELAALNIGTEQKSRTEELRNLNAISKSLGDYTQQMKDLTAKMFKQNDETDQPSGKPIFGDDLINASGK
jgi:hypothetical protein